MIKRIFLNFIQAYFAQHTKYTWSLGPDSKILIIDKYAMDLTQTAKKPSIVLSRGGMRWANSSIGQLSQRSIVSANAVFTDLSAGTITLNCIAKNGIVCEELALTLRNLFTAYKLQLKKVGIHSIDNIAIDEERTLMADSDIVLTVVPVTIQYSKQSTLQYLQDFYSVNATLTFSGINYGGYSGYITPENTSVFQLYENQHYTTWASGIVFSSGFAPPTGSILNLTYIDEATLQTIEEVASGTINNVNRVFNTNYPIYGDYPLLSDIVFNLPSNSDTIGINIEDFLYDYYQNTFNWNNFDSETNVINGEYGELDIDVTPSFTIVPRIFQQYYGTSPYSSVSGLTSAQRIKFTDKFTFAISYYLSSYLSAGTLFNIGDHTLNRLSVYVNNIDSITNMISVIYENDTGRLSYVMQVSGIINNNVKLAVSIDVLNSGITAAYYVPRHYVFPNYYTVTGILRSYTDISGVLSTGISNPYLTLGGPLFGAASTQFAEFRFYSTEIFSLPELYTIASGLKDKV